MIRPRELLNKGKCGVKSVLFEILFSFSLCIAYFRLNDTRDNINSCYFLRFIVKCSIYSFFSLNTAESRLIAYALPLKKLRIRRNIAHLNHIRCFVFSFGMGMKWVCWLMVYLLFSFSLIIHLLWDYGRVTVTLLRLDREGPKELMSTFLPYSPSTTCWNCGNEKVVNGRFYHFQTLLWEVSNKIIERLNGIDQLEDHSGDMRSFYIGLVMRRFSE